MDRCVRLANDVGRQQQHLPPAEAAAAVAAHIEKFWEPRMRRALGEALLADSSDALPAVVAAYPMLHTVRAHRVVGHVDLHDDPAHPPADDAEA